MISDLTECFSTGMQEDNTAIDSTHDILVALATIYIYGVKSTKKFIVIYRLCENIS
jgi:hypothetical protein